MNIIVIGAGYVGLVTSSIFAHIGHIITCVDNDAEKINILNKGDLPFYENGLLDLITLNKSRLKFTTEYKNTLKKATIIFITVGTPERKNGTTNMSHVDAVCRQISKYVETECVIIIKSTVPVGSGDDIEKYIRGNLKIKNNIHVVSNPEFLSQGTAVHDALFAQRIIVGSNDNFASDILKKIYKPLTKQPYNSAYLEMDRRSAEVVKYACNGLLALKLSYINEIANYCEQVDANIIQVTMGMNHDRRIGTSFLNAGIGYGGSCFSKDAKSLIASAQKNNIDLKILKLAQDVNNRQKLILINKIKKDYGCLKGIKITVLGASFKPETNDVREAPSVNNIKKLLSYGAIVSIYDPLNLDEFKKIFGKKIRYFNNISKSINGADACMIMTEWKQIKDYDFLKYKKYMKTANIYDGRNCYNLNLYSYENIYYASIGRLPVGKFIHKT